MRLDLDSRTCETGGTSRTNDCLNLAGGLDPVGGSLNLVRGEGHTMLDSENCSNLLSHASHASRTSYGREALSILPTPNSQLTEGDCGAGFVLSGVGYGEVFDFAPPDDAVVCDDWLRFGAHEESWG